MKRFQGRLIALACFAGLSSSFGSAHATQSGTWHPLTHALCTDSQPCFSPKAALLLTDGTVIINEQCGGRWFRLTPDINGSYQNGSWSQIASFPTGYAPLYFASQVLPDGRIIINGGEYNSCVPVWTTQGAMYDPLSNVWTSVGPPSGWATIGDAQSIVLPNGQYMLANCCTKQQALLNLATMTWTPTGSNKADINDEEGWTLLPDGSVLTVDANNPANLTNSERYLPNTGGWVSAGSTIVKLADTNANNSGSHEMGPQVLRPDGTVFATGATGATATYDTKHGFWTVGPSFPDVMGQGQFDVADGPASILTDGNVLVAASPGVFQKPTHMFEFDGNTLTRVADPPNAQNQSSYFGFMVALPTGEILFTTGSPDIEIYSPAGTFKEPWRPTIEQGPFTLVHGETYQVYGRLFNGRSGGSAYGDDYQAATNYPLVRITNLATGHVFYCRTFNPDSITPTNNGRVNTNFTVPSGIELGDSQVEVVTNGIPSRAKAASVM